MSEIIQGKDCEIGHRGITIHYITKITLLDGNNRILLCEEEMDELTQKWNRYRGREFENERGEIPW